MPLNTKQLALIASLALLGFASAEDPRRPAGVTVATPDISQVVLEHDNLKHHVAPHPSSQANIDASALLAAETVKIDFISDDRTFKYKQFHTKEGHDAVLLGYQVSDNDVLFGKRASPTAIQNLIDGAEKLVVHDGPIDGQFNRYTLMLFKQDWSHFGLSSAEKQLFRDYMLRRARYFINDPGHNAQYFIRDLNYRIPRGIHCIIVREANFDSPEPFSVPMMSIHKLDRYAGHPETVMFRIQNVFNEHGKYGVYYEIGHDLPMLPNLEKLQKRESWTQSDHVTAVTVDKVLEKYTVYFKIRGVSQLDTKKLKKLANFLAGMHSNADDILSMEHNWTSLFSHSNNKNELRFPPDWFSSFQLSIGKKNVKILVVRDE